MVSLTSSCAFVLCAHAGTATPSTNPNVKRRNKCSLAFRDPPNWREKSNLSQINRMANACGCGIVLMFAPELTFYAGVREREYGLATHTVSTSRFGRQFAM